MTGSTMLAIEIGLPAAEGGRWICAVTGRAFDLDPRPVREVFSDNFGSFDILAAPGSAVVCPYVADRLADGNLRWRSWWVGRDGVIHHGKRGDIKPIVAEQALVPPFGIYCAEDTRRQGGLLTRANGSWGTAVVQIGPRVARLRAALSLHLGVMEMYDLGATRGDLARMSPPKKWTGDLAAWARFVRTHRAVATSAEYALAVWLIPAKDTEKEEECELQE